MRFKFAIVGNAAPSPFADNHIRRSTFLAEYQISAKQTGGNQPRSGSALELVDSIGGQDDLSR